MAMSSASKQLAVRWLRRYKIFFTLGLLIATVQVFLAYKSMGINESNSLQRAKFKFASAGADADTGVNVGIGTGGNHNSVSDDEDVSVIELRKHASDTASAPNIAAAVPSTGNVLSESMLGFKPHCSITTKEAISALQRAKTKACRQQIVRIVCAIQSGEFYASHLPSYCPAGNYTANAPLGCYRDEKDARLLTGYFTNFKMSNSPKHCMHLCLQSGFPYAGVQYGIECFCGIETPPKSAKLADSSCNMKCSGDAKEVCGGYFSMNIFETGISKFAVQTAELIAKPNTERVRIVFLLTLNGRALRQIHRLIRALYAPEHMFYIHVDARQDYLYRKLLELEARFSNIRLARKRYATIWGGASLLTMLMQCMQDLLSSNWQWDFVINLSESDFPVKTVDKLADFLTANRGRNFVKSHGRETQRFVQKQGLDKTFVECDTHMWRVGDRKLPYGMQVDGGSDWVALTKSFVEYIILQQHNDELLRGLLVIFRHTLLPAESFFHTVLRNSQFCNTYVDNNLHVTNWKRKLGCKCQYKHVVDWCGCSPNDFKPDDWSRLQATEQKMLYFARKFEPIINQAIVLQLEEWLFGAYDKDYVNLHAYWQSFYNVDDAASSEHDLMRTIAESVLRNSAHKLQLHVSSYRLQELTHYLQQDQYKGFLLRYKAAMSLAQQTNTSLELELEVRVRPVQYSKLHKNSKLAKRVRNFEVSSEFDQKEQISRNFAKLLGPYGEPVVSFAFLAANNERADAAHSYNLTLLWIDPLGQLQDFNELHIEDDAQIDVIYFSKSLLKQPLLPGIWTVKLIGRSAAYVQTKFLIAPLTLHKGRAINTPEKAAVINAGAGSNLPADFIMPTEWLQHLYSADNVQQLQLLAQANAQRTGDSLLNWLDELVGKFYHLREVCAVNEQTAAAVAIAVPLCADTSWSSLAADPKSNIWALSKPPS